MAEKLIYRGFDLRQISSLYWRWIDAEGNVHDSFGSLEAAQKDIDRWKKEHSQ